MHYLQGMVLHKCLQQDCDTIQWYSNTNLGSAFSHNFKI